MLLTLTGVFVGTLRNLGRNRCMICTPCYFRVGSLAPNSAQLLVGNHFSRTRCFGLVAARWLRLLYSVAVVGRNELDAPSRSMDLDSEVLRNVHIGYGIG